MRSQLQEADQEKATLLMVQRQNKADIAKLTEGLEAAQGKRESLDRELALAQTQLKVRLVTFVSAWQASALFFQLDLEYIKQQEPAHSHSQWEVMQTCSKTESWTSAFGPT